MNDGAVIPIERTAVPVEWNEVKEQLMRLATELGPDNGMSTGSVGRFIDSAANALDGNGDKLRQTLAQLSGVGRILANGSGDIADTIGNLQTFVTALRDSNDQIVQFQDRFATLTSVVNDSRSDLDAALKNLSDVVGETTRFIHDTRDKTAEQIQRLANVTQNLADHRMDLETFCIPHPTGLRTPTTCSTRVRVPRAVCSCSATWRTRCGSSAAWSAPSGMSPLRNPPNCVRNTSDPRCAN